MAFPFLAWCHLQCFSRILGILEWKRSTLSIISNSFPKLMKLGDSSLGNPVTKDKHTYDDNCELEWANVWDNLDHYFFLHCLNWFLLSFLLRDAWLLNFWQLFDEIIELSWQHILPHFRECWWDHVFLDVLIGNTLFIFIGLWVSKKMGIEQFDWLGRGTRKFSQWKVWHDYKYFKFIKGILELPSELGLLLQ